MCAALTTDRVETGDAVASGSTSTCRERPLGSRSRGRAARAQVVPSSVWFGPAVGEQLRQEFLAFLGSHNGVAVLQWPRDAEHVPALARVGLPRLLLVHPPADAPVAGGLLQKALAASAGDDEIHASLLALCRRARHRRSVEATPVVDDEGWVRTAAGRVGLPPAEHRLAEPLVASFGHPVDDAVLRSCDRQPSSFPTAFEGRLARLCHHVNPLGLEVVAVPDGAHLMRWCRT